MKLVNDYMKRKVITVKPTDSIFKVAETLSEHHISGTPVVNKRKVVGVISEADIVKFMKLDLSKTHTELMAEPHALSVVILTLIKDQLGIKKHLEEMSKIQAKDLMSKEIISVSPNESILEAASILDHNHIERLPVINKGRLVGIISRSDLIRALVD